MHTRACISNVGLAWRLRDDADCSVRQDRQRDSPAQDEGWAEGRRRPRLLSPGTL